MILKNKTYHVNRHWLFEEFFMKDDVSLVATGLLDNNQNLSLLARNKFISAVRSQFWLGVGTLLEN